MLVSPFDIAIILISSVACVYCMVLSRRLRALQNTRNGLGATIRALSDSISAVSATTDETRYHAGELATRLAHLIEDAKTSCDRVQRLTEKMEQAEQRSSQQIDLAQKQVSGSMQDALDLSNQRLREISDLMHRMKHLSEETGVPIAAEQRPAPAPPVQLRSRMKVV